MDKKTAEQVNNLMLEYSGKLDDSIRLVMNTCSEQEFNEYRDAVSQIMTTMLLDIMNPIYKSYPDLKPVQLP